MSIVSNTGFSQMASAFSAASGIAQPRPVIAEPAATCRPTRMGQFSFINSLPIVLPFERGAIELDAEVTLEPPSRLNKLIGDGALDVSAMSSFGFIGRNDLAFIPHVSISCTGAVGSVLLFSKHSLEELAQPNRLVVASAQSASSVNLLKVLMMESFGSMPTVASDGNPELDVDAIDGVLVIGDHALEVDTTWSMRYLRIDMGDWWWRRYHLPMVFGLWAARMDWIEKNPSAYATISDALRRSKNLGLTEYFNDVLDEAEQRTGLARTRLQHYYQTQLNFDLTPNHLEGLKLYQTLAEKHGLLGR